MYSILYILLLSVTKLYSKQVGKMLLLLFTIYVETFMNVFAVNRIINTYDSTD